MAKLVIKINNLNGLPDDLDYSKYEEDQILWGRIVGVALFGLVLLIALLAGIWNALTSEQEVVAGELASTVHPAQDSQLAQNSLQVNTVPGKAGFDSIASQPVVISQVDNKPNVEHKSNVVHKSNVENRPDAGHKTKSAEVLPQSGASNPFASGGARSLPELNQQPPAAGLPASQSNGLNAPGNPVKTLMPQIVDAQLTHTLNAEKMPEQALGRVIPMGSEGIIRVYLYTDMKGLQGETLIHKWYRDDKLMATVRIPVGGERYKASSSKFIDQYMLGDWRVIVVDEPQKIRYAEARFSVLPQG
ncbi:hypothetical protein OLMES_4874 [Oleiphilus messinensis]|uniref:DUF2914 domain-containing protein n=1 Tax=Oleiphilus messinensis TaxID=141451 RepID=A0A1Y0IED0_9GAMM|nr:DUF2914 domain-containing protein [Oleiphilus messinensis]ARU58862.1 hypothetical protein OLMES_4874 [Oleiphilus messinensis]